MMFLNSGPALRTLENKYLERAAKTNNFATHVTSMSLASRYGLLAYSAERSQPVQHRRDSDCLPDPSTGLCFDCGTLHGDPCPACEQRAFHTDDCPIYTEAMSVGDESRQPIRVPNNDHHLSHFPDAVALLYMAISLGLAAWITEIGLHFHN